MRSEPPRLRGLYAIIDTATLATTDPRPATAAVMAGGAALVQYRDKGTDPSRRRRQGEALVTLGRKYGVPVIINDDIELAAACGAAGVHVGSDDCAPEQARRRLGADALIGVSCYADLARAHAAARAGADYIAFGRMFPSPTKPGGPHPAPELLDQARRATGLAVCAIGGITLNSAPELVAAGADLVAVIGDLLQSDNIRAHATAYARLFAPIA